MLDKERLSQISGELVEQVAKLLETEFKKHDCEGADCAWIMSAITTELAASAIIGNLKDEMLDNDEVITEFIDGYCKLFIKTAHLVRQLCKDERAGKYDFRRQPDQQQDPPADPWA